MNSVDKKGYVLEWSNTPNGIYYKLYKRVNFGLIFEQDGYTTQNTIDRFLEA